jgi:hypothetical protein
MLLLKAHMRSNQASRQAQRKRDEIQLEYIRMKFHEWQSAEATRRAEMKL